MPVLISAWLARYRIVADICFQRWQYIACKWKKDARMNDERSRATDGVFEKLNDRVNVPTVEGGKDSAKVVVAQEADQFTHDPHTETPMQVNLVAVLML